MKRIDEIFAFIADDTDDTEGVTGFRGPDGAWMPMVCADKARVDSLRPVAQHIAEITGKKIRLVRFSVREVVEEIA